MRTSRLHKEKGLGSADYAVNHPFVKTVVHNLFSDIKFAMVLTKRRVVTTVSKIHIFNL